MASLMIEGNINLAFASNEINKSKNKKWTGNSLMIKTKRAAVFKSLIKKEKKDFLQYII